jgi:hypothetical protein
MIGIGSRLKTNSSRLMMMNVAATFRTNSPTSLDVTWKRSSSEPRMTRSGSATRMAMTRFEIGPAAATIASPRRPPWRFVGL